MLLCKSGKIDFSSASAVRRLADRKIASYTTYGLGGLAKKIYFPKTPLQAKAAFDEAVSNGERIVILGNGSDVLIADGYYDGSVICMRETKGIIRIKNDELICLSGTTVLQLLNYCKRRSLGGLEYLYGIPATIGGLACMNGGAQGKYICQNVVNVRLYNGKNVTLSNKSCNFYKKHSTMRDINSLILYVTLKVFSSTSEEIERTLSVYKEKRVHQPTGRSCGCVFVNPDCCSAGYLIDKCGLKNFRIGGAVVSPEHANFIINDGGTAEDVKAVIRFVKRRVYETYGIILEDEVVYIGDFNDSDG